MNTRNFAIKKEKKRNIWTSDATPTKSDNVSKPPNTTTMASSDPTSLPSVGKYLHAKACPPVIPQLLSKLTIPRAPEIRQTNFEQGIAYALHLWPDLTLAVRENLGGPDSADKRDWLAGALSDLFPSFSSTKADDVDNIYIQEFLQQVMEDEFEVIIEEGDPSLWKVAEQIVRIRRDCAEGRFENVDVLRVRWQEGKGKKIDGLYKKGEDPNQDTDWDEDGEDDDDDDDDEDMGDAPPLVQTRREKPEPEVDEDGFTKVTRKKR